MSKISVRAPARKASLHAVVTRADGRVENLGVISYYHRFAPLRWIVNLYINVKRKVAW